MRGELHPDVSALLGDEPPRDRTELLRHLEACAACRARLAVEDASRLFGLLALEPVPPGILDRVSRAVERATAEDSPPRARRAWLLPAASIAASLILAGSFATYLLQHEPPPARELALAPALLPTTPSGVAEARFELLASPGEAQVVDLAVGEMQLVMIFDEELDL